MPRPEREKNPPIVNPRRPPLASEDVKLLLNSPNPHLYIPKGPYCYNDVGLCPFWDKNRNQPDQLSGYCHFLKLGDWMDDTDGSWTMLLWDQVKECGVDDDFEDAPECLCSEGQIGGGQEGEGSV